MMSNRIVVITGASSGIGLAAAKLFCAKGQTVYNLSRTPSSDDAVKNIHCDVTDEQSVKSAFEKIESDEGKINVLVINAGYGISGAAETTPSEQVFNQFDVNFFGAVRCVKYAAPLLRNAEKSERRIIFLSSLAAVLPIPFQSFYSASKAAISCFARALALEMRPFGVKVSAVLPGDIKTSFTDKREKTVEDEIYSETAARAVHTMEKDERNGMPPEKIARLIFKISKKRHPGNYYTAGAGYKIIMFFSKLLPSSLIDWVIGKIYCN